MDKEEIKRKQIERNKKAGIKRRERRWKEKRLGGIEKNAQEMERKGTRRKDKTVPEERRNGNRENNEEMEGKIRK